MNILRYFVVVGYPKPPLTTVVGVFEPPLKKKQRAALSALAEQTPNVKVKLLGEGDVTCIRASAEVLMYVVDFFDKVEERLGYKTVDGWKD